MCSHPTTSKVFKVVPQRQILDVRISEWTGTVGGGGVGGEGYANANNANANNANANANA